MSSPLVVVKIGGGVVEDAAVTCRVLQDLAYLLEEGVRVVLMHGGGPQATALAERLGQTPNIVGGRRITDGPTLEVMKMILGGTVATNLLGYCRGLALPAVHVSGVSSDVIQATKRPPRIVSGGGDAPIDFGHVGDIDAIGTELLEHLLQGGFLPVVNSLGADRDGNVLNINADIAATRMAMALGAERLFLLTGAPGVLEDASDFDSRIPQLTIAQGRRAIADGTIGGGMIPKLEESFKALESGLNFIHVLAADQPGGVRSEWDQPGSVGTALRRS